MAKAGFIMNGAQGSTGLTTYYRRNGKTIQRVKVAPANPQTDSQMAQRIIFATVTQAAKFLEPIINHSFESVKYGTKSVNHFVSKNIKQLRTLAAKDYNALPSTERAVMSTTTKGVSQLVPNNFIISDGQLLYNGVIDAARVSDDNGEAWYIISKVLNLPILWNKEGDIIKLKVKAGDFMMALLGLKDNKDQITFVNVYGDENDPVYVMPGGDGRIGSIICKTFMDAKRIVLAKDFDANALIQIGTATVGADDQPDQVATLALAAAFTNLAQTSFNLNLSSPDVAYIVYRMLLSLDQEAIGGGQAVFDNEGDKWQLVITPDLDGHEWGEAMPSGTQSFKMIAGAVIRSRQTSKKWLRSKSEMKSAIAGLYWANANAAWFAGEELSSNERYLNEGKMTE